MSKLHIENGVWVVVCDGRKALVAVNAGDAEYLNLKVVEEHESRAPKTSEIGSDRPGRTQQSVGGGGATVGHGGSRSSVGQTDWHDQAEREFLKSVAERINRGAGAGEMKAVVIAAPPRALGALKPMLSKAAAAVVRAYLDKDYVKMPISEIEKRLKQAE